MFVSTGSVADDLSDAAFNLQSVSAVLSTIISDFSGGSVSSLLNCNCENMLIFEISLSHVSGLKYGTQQNYYPITS